MSRRDERMPERYTYIILHQIMLIFLRVHSNLSLTMGSANNNAVCVPGSVIIWNLH